MTNLNRRLMKTVKKHFPKALNQTFQLEYEGVNYIREDVVELMLEDKGEEL
jgi:hypothetical protein